LKKRPVIRFTANSDVTRRIAADLAAKFQGENELFHFRVNGPHPVLFILDRKFATLRCALCAVCCVRCALCCGDFWILMDLRFAHMHEQHSHSIIRSFESLSRCDLTARKE
jgi:hypothetical protein